MDPNKLQLMLKINQIAAEAKITASAAENIRAWLTEPHYAMYADDVAAPAAVRGQTVDDVFWTVIPFGTGGPRQDVSDRLECNQ